LLLLLQSYLKRAYGKILPFQMPVSQIFSTVTVTSEDCAFALHRCSKHVTGLLSGVIKVKSRSQNTLDRPSADPLFRDSIARYLKCTLRRVHQDNDHLHVYYRRPPGGHIHWLASHAPSRCGHICSRTPYLETGKAVEYLVIHGSLLLLT
jgi:hypothetical protein